MGQWHIVIAGLPLLCPSLVVKYGAVARIFRVAGPPLLCPSLVHSEIWEEAPSMGDRSTVCAVTCI